VLLKTATVNPSENKAWVHSLVGRRKVTKLPYDGEIADVALGPEGNLLALAIGPTAQIFDVTTRDRRVIIDAGGLEHLPVEALFFSPGGRYLGTGRSDGVVQIWPLETSDLVEKVRSRLHRNLTTDEWNRYLPGQPYRKTFAELP
jgi:WD40 repeat protein